MSSLPDKPGEPGEPDEPDVSGEPGEPDASGDPDASGGPDLSGEPDVAGEAGTPEPEADPTPGPSWEHRARTGSGRGQRLALDSPARRAAGLAAALVTVAVLAAGLWSVSSVRTVLLQSFTRQQTPYTELYFTDSPRFDGGKVVVPVAVNAHGTGVTSYRLRVTLESAGGRPVGTATVKFAPRDGKPVPVVARVGRKTAEVAVVRVALVGHRQSLHYSFVTPSPSVAPTATPSATRTP